MRRWLAIVVVIAVVGSLMALAAIPIWQKREATPGRRALTIGGLIGMARLIARGADDPATIPTLLDVLQHDPSPAVRGTVAFPLAQFPDDSRVVAALKRSASTDVDSEVREDAQYGLTGSA